MRASIFRSFQNITKQHLNQCSSIYSSCPSAPYAPFIDKYVRKYFFISCAHQIKWRLTSDKKRVGSRMLTHKKLPLFDRPDGWSENS